MENELNEPLTLVLTIVLETSNLKVTKGHQALTTKADQNSFYRSTLKVHSKSSKFASKMSTLLIVTLAISARGNKAKSDSHEMTRTSRHELYDLNYGMNSMNSGKGASIEPF